MGDDVYVVDVATDLVIENANEGIDIIHTVLATYSIAALTNVENLTYTDAPASPAPAMRPPTRSPAAPATIS